MTTDMSARSFESGFFARPPPLNGDGSLALQREVALLRSHSERQLEQRLHYLCSDDRVARKGCDKVAVVEPTVLLNKVFQDSNGIYAFSGNSLLVPQQKKKVAGLQL